MNRALVAMAFCVSAAGLAACADPNRYVPPELAQDAAAIITGSKIHDPDPLVPDIRVYLDAIDGKHTMDGAFEWDDRTIVSPGMHLIKFGVSSKRFMFDAWGSGEAQRVLEAGKTYTLRATVPVQISDLCARSNVWLEGEDGAPIGDKVAVIVATYSGAELPLTGGGFISIPSHTVCPPS
jgi:hypothetical protein